MRYHNRAARESCFQGEVIVFDRGNDTLQVMKLGAHMPTSGGVWKALGLGASIGCASVQVFVKNNKQWLWRAYTPEEVNLFAKARAEHAEMPVFGHAGYLINLGGPAGPNREQSIRSLLQEIELASQLKLPFLVMHPGAHLGSGEATGLKQIVAGLDEVFTATKSAKVRIALEVTAGQGSCLGYKFAHLAEIYAGVKQPKRLAVCLDTAHLFAAGYDVRTPRGWDAAVDELDECLGFNQVVAVHLNDSKSELGSRVDRHEHIGHGKIGREGFRHILRDARFTDLPGCLETPKSKDLHEDVENLAVLRELAQSRKARK
jgi:deoxyribonuclease-4